MLSALGEARMVSELLGQGGRELGIREIQLHGEVRKGFLEEASLVLEEE